MGFKSRLATKRKRFDDQDATHPFLTPRTQLLPVAQDHLRHPRFA